MRASIAVLFLASFLQAVYWPLDLVLLIIAVRAFAVSDDLNYYLAFGFGLLVALLNNLPLGSLSLIYLLAVVLIGLLKRFDFFSHWIMSLPVGLAILVMGAILVNLLGGVGWASNFSFLFWLLQLLLILPVYAMVRFWEERFIPQKEIRLKLGK